MRQAAVKALTRADCGKRGHLLGVSSAYWLSLQALHPAAVAQGLTIPLLPMPGARDYQVTPAGFSGWKAALAHRPPATVKLSANLFHLFMPVAPAGRLSSSPISPRAMSILKPSTTSPPASGRADR